ncbi:hypothetical protein Taro_029711 [Colocasia esculenta]|uniref:Uncharacterized protein n=1 Tax=Colocasia esculenta TaxID=4460 RepID=A0A843VPU1_COLES|nr:hypothetical protein [Colocasia esculenta]
MNHKLKFQPECVNTTTECVDTLSHLRKKGLLDAGSSVDTTTECVDTLSQSDKRISWKLGLVSTLPLTVSTHLTLSYFSKFTSTSVESHNDFL